VLIGHHLVADGRLGLALSAFHERVTAPPLPNGAATTTAGATPHLLTHRGDAVTGPGSAGRTEKVPEEAAEMEPECG
jgi:hypothetical protein